MPGEELLIGKGPKNKCPQHHPVPIEFAAGHDRETQVLGALWVVKVMCFFCGLIQRVPAAAFEEEKEPDEAETTN